MSDDSAKGRGRSGGAGRSGSRERRRERVPLGELAPISAGVVTALDERRAGSARYVVSVGGVPVATVSAQIIAQMELRVGLRLEEAATEALREEASALAVFDKAVELLAVRARSVRDLRLRLRRAGASDARASGAVARLVELGVLDDAEFARTLTRSRALSGGVSKRRIQQELQRKGVAREVVDEAVSDALSDVELDEEGGALTVARKRLSSLRSLDAATRRRRLYAFLARRGYTHDVITRVMRSVLD